MENVLYPEFGKNLKKYRLIKNLKLEELKDKITIATSTLSDIENGKKDPTIEQVSIISKYFNVSIYDLFGQQEQPYYMEALKLLAFLCDHKYINDFEIQRDVDIYVSGTQQSEKLDYNYIIGFKSSLFVDFINNYLGIVNLEVDAEDTKLKLIKSFYDKILMKKENIEKNIKSNEDTKSEK